MTIICILIFIMISASFVRSFLYSGLKNQLSHPSALVYRGKYHVNGATALFAQYSTKYSSKKTEKISNTKNEKKPPVSVTFDFATMTESDYTNALKRFTRNYQPEETKKLVGLIQQYSKKHTPLSLPLLTTTLKALYVHDCPDHVIAEFQHWYQSHEGQITDHYVQHPNATLRIVEVLSEINQVQLAVNYIQTPLDHALFALPTKNEIEAYCNNTTSIFQHPISTTPNTTCSYAFPSKWTDNSTGMAQLPWMVIWYQDVLARIALGHVLAQQYTTFRQTLQQMIFLQDQLQSFLHSARSSSSLSQEKELTTFQFQPEHLKRILKTLLKSTISSPTTVLGSTKSYTTASIMKGGGGGVPTMSVEMLEYFQLLTRLDPHTIQSNDMIQIFIGNYFYQIEFVTGAVSMETLPSSQSRVLSSPHFPPEQLQKSSGTKTPPAAAAQESLEDMMKEHDTTISITTKSEINPFNIPEYIFIGRSNVGKSSLINLLTNRKRLAFTSKLAGKTTEFNYYHIQNGFATAAATTTDTTTTTAPASPSSSSSKGKPLSTAAVHNNHQQQKLKMTPQSYLQHALELYLVDLPGVGYAKRSQQLISSWTELMQEYVQTRQSLQSIFHLIDSRHGLLDADYDCLSLLSKLPPHVDYVIVFTKIDKQYGHVVNHVKNPSIQATLASYIHPTVIQQVEAEVNKYRHGTEAMEDGSSRKTGNVKIFYTSSVTKEGGVDLIQYILSTIVQRRQKSMT